MTISASTPLETEFGNVTINYHQHLDDRCLSIVVGDVSENTPLVRLHSSCLFGESFLGIDCDCKLQLNRTIEMICKEKCGLVIYLFQEGRGHGLEMKIRLMNAEKEFNIDTVDAFRHFNLDLDPRNYSIATQALIDLNVSKSLRLITNNPLKKQWLENAGYKIVEVVALEYPINNQVKKYLKVKKEKLGHTINYLDEGTE